MSEVELKIDEVEPTQEQLEKAAAKQLMAELFMIQRRIYGIKMNSMLIVQCKQLARGLISKYRSVGLFENDDVEVKYIKKFGQIEFVPSPRLKELFNQISDELAAEAEKRKIDLQDAEDSLNA